MSLKEWYETFILWKTQISGCWIHPFLIQQRVIEFRFGSSEFLPIFMSQLCHGVKLVWSTLKRRRLVGHDSILACSSSISLWLRLRSCGKVAFQWCWSQPRIWLVTIGDWRKRLINMGYCCGYSLEDLVPLGISVCLNL